MRLLKSVFVTIYILKSRTFIISNGLIARRPSLLKCLLCIKCTILSTKIKYIVPKNP